MLRHAHPSWLSISCIVLLAFSGDLAAEESIPQGSIDANVKIALVQARPENDPDRNIDRAERYCRDAAEAGADIVLFPEMFSVGYETKIDFEDPAEVDAWKAKAWRTDGPIVKQFCDLAKKLDLAIAITYLEEKDGSLRNATTVIDRHGQTLLTYAKVHTCRFFPMEGSLLPGEDFYVAELDTRAGPVQVGVMTCYDREFPESARILMLKGAEIILTPNACGLEELRLKQFQVRAWENAVVTAMANYASGQGNGRSCVFGADGKEVLLADDSEGLQFAEIDLTKLRRTREKTFWGNAWRRPELYERMISPEIQSPFKRTDAFDRPNSESVMPHTD